MLITKEVEVKINNTSVNHYRNLGYDVKNNDIIKIPVEHLSVGSHIKVCVKCDICDVIKNIEYKTYIKTNTYEVDVCNKNECKQIKIKISNQKNYGVDYPAQLKEILNKSRKTSLERYGVESQFQLRDKIRESWFKKYGTDNPSKTKIVRDKFKKTCLEKYGVDHMGKTFQVKEKIKNSKILNTMARFKKYNIIRIDNNYNYIMMCEKGHEFTINNVIYQNRKNESCVLCTVCNPLNSFSSSCQEIELQNFIKNNYNGNISFNCRDLINKEIDVYIPDLKLALELNGLYWHSDKYLSKDSHLNKTEECEKLGIKLIHIWEDDWLYRKDLIKSIILFLLKNLKKPEINNVRIDRIDARESKDFIEKYDIKNYIQSDINIGLYSDKILISVLCLNRKNESFIINNFCSITYVDHTIYKKLIFEYFINEFKPENIIIEINRSYDIDNYYDLGFITYRKTKPNCYSIKNRKKHKDIENNLNKIYDSGNIIYSFKTK